MATPQNPKQRPPTTITSKSDTMVFQASRSSSMSWRRVSASSKSDSTCSVSTWFETEWLSSCGNDIFKLPIDCCPELIGRCAVRIHSDFPRCSMSVPWNKRQRSTCGQEKNNHSLYRVILAQSLWGLKAWLTFANSGMWRNGLTWFRCVARSGLRPQPLFRFKIES